MVVQQAGKQPRTHPFAQALRRAIDIRGVTLTWLHDTLTSRGVPVSIATLSSWRSGARQPEGERSFAVVRELEAHLGLPVNALTALIGPSRRIARVGDIDFPWDDETLDAAARELLGGLDTDLPPRTREVSTQSVADVGPNGGVTVRRMRSLLQSTSGVITSLPIMEVMPWVAIPQPTFRAISGGRIRQSAAHPSGRVFGAVIELDQPLVPGATTILETEVRFSPDGPPVQETGHGVGRSIRELLLWIRFTPGALPEWCNLVEDLPGKPLSVQPFPLGRGGAAHIVRAPFGPGALGVHWGMEPPARGVPFA